MAQRRKRRKRKMRKGFKAFVLLLFVLAALITLMLSPFFNVTSIEVFGNTKVSSESIIAASGLTLEENSFKLSLKEAKANIYALPYIDTVSVKRRFPDKIHITVTEGEIVAYIASADKLTAIDKNGKSLEFVPFEAEINHPIFAGAEMNEVTLGQVVTAKDNKTMETILKYIGYLQDYNLHMVRTVNVSNPYDVHFILKEGLKVYMGDDTEIGYKAAYLKAILNQIGEGAKGSLDLRHPENGVPQRGEQLTPPPSPEPAKETASTDENSE